MLSLSNRIFTILFYSTNIIWKILFLPQELQEKSNEIRTVDTPAGEAVAETEEETDAATIAIAKPSMDTEETMADPQSGAIDSTKQSEVLGQGVVAATVPATKEIIADEMDLDFEEISDGELEEEARIRGLGDALGVDWASLVAESKAIAKEKSLSIVKETTAKQRWQPHRILLDVGVSFRMAGKEFASNVLNQAHRRLKDEEEKLMAALRAAEDEARDNLAAGGTTTTIKGVTIKKEMLDEPIEQHVDGFAIKEIKEENGAPDGTVDAEMTAATTAPPLPAVLEEELLIHPIACVQVASRVNAEQRRNLVFNATGPYSRALSARRDIQMRRQLCGLPIKKSCGGRVLAKTAATSSNACYAQIARQLFEKALAKVN